MNNYVLHFIFALSVLLSASLTADSNQKPSKNDQQLSDCDATELVVCRPRLPRTSAAGSFIAVTLLNSGPVTVPVGAPILFNSVDSTDSTSSITYDNGTFTVTQNGSYAVHYGVNNVFFSGGATGPNNPLPQPPQVVFNIVINNNVAGAPTGGALSDTSGIISRMIGISTILNLDPGDTFQIINNTQPPPGLVPPTNLFIGTSAFNPPNEPPRTPSAYVVVQKL